MPTNLEQFNENVIEFNRKYKSNFTEEAFRQMATTKGWNAAYWHTYTDLASNLADEKIAGTYLPSLYEMLNDFETMLMKPYRMHRSEQPDYDLIEDDFLPYGGVNNTQTRVLMLKSALQNKPVYTYQLMGKAYLNGETRIRDMVAAARAATKDKVSMSNEEGAEILKYALALEYAHSQRPKFFWLFHPFRNHAEQRDAALIRSLVSERFTLGVKFPLDMAKKEFVPQIRTDMTLIASQENNEVLIPEAEVEKYNFFNEKEEIVFDKKEIEEQIGKEFLKEFDEEGEHLTEEDLLEGEKELFPDLLNIAKENNNNLDSFYYEGVSSVIENDNKIIKENNEKQVVPQQQVVKEEQKPISIFAKIGYRPNIDNLKAEGKEYKIMERKIKYGEIKSSAEKTIIEKNLKRYLEIYNMSVAHSDNVKRLLNEKEETYVKEDNELREKFPNYDTQAKQNVQNINNQEKEKIIINLNESGVKEKSSFVKGEDVKIAPPTSKK